MEFSDTCQNPSGRAGGEERSAGDERLVIREHECIFEHFSTKVPLEVVKRGRIFGVVALSTSVSFEETLDTDHV